MKRALCGMLLVAVASLGCLPLRQEDKPPKVVMKPAPPPAVTEHGITDKNAAEKAEALRRELEHELARPVPGAEDR